MKRESRTVSQAPLCRCELQGWRWEVREWLWKYLNTFLALSLGRSETWSFHRLPPPPSLLLFWTRIQGSGQSCVRQVSPPCSTWGREERWWVNPPLFSIRCWNVGDAGTFLCPKGRLLLCGHDWWQQDCLTPADLLAWCEGGSDVAFDWSSLHGFLMWGILHWPTSPSPLQPNWLLAKEAVSWRTKLFFRKWWGHLIPSHTFLQSQCHKTSNLFIRKQSLEGHTLETLIFLFFFNVAFPSILMPLVLGRICCHLLQKRWTPVFSPKSCLDNLFVWINLRAQDEFSLSHC